MAGTANISHDKYYDEGVRAVTARLWKKRRKRRRRPGKWKNQKKKYRRRRYIFLFFFFTSVYVVKTSYQCTRVANGHRGTAELFFFLGIIRCVSFF